MTMGKGAAITEHERWAGATVLVVEDNSIIGLDLQLTLEAFGYRVLGPASSNEEVLAMLARERRPDAAVVDLHLTDGLATPVTEALSALAIPFMLLTGSDDDDAALPGSAPQLDKPYVLDALERTVRKLLGRSIQPSPAPAING
jgi:two-component system, response regulator PdtaR